MSIKDELHDLRLVGLRHYLLLYRQGAEEREERRIMRTSTFRALSSAYEEEPAEWDRETLDEVLDDTVEVNRTKALERTTWLFVVCLFATGAFFAGWYVRPMDEPEPIDCTATVRDYDREVTMVHCVGDPE